MSFADTLTSQQRKHYRNVAVTSAMFGCISTQLIESNAMIVLYLTLLGGSDSISMFSSGLPSISHILLLIPCASFAARFGLRKTYTFSSAVGFFAFLLIAAAPWLGNFSRHAVLAGCFIYALTLTIYLSTWVPLLDNMLCSNERGAFFSRMRVTYMLFNAVLLFALGKLLNQSPSLMVLQIVFIVAGLGLWGRKFCMDALPIDPEMRRESPNLKESLSTCLHNQPLVGFAVYFCFLYLAFSTAMPLALVYMKTNLKLPDGTIVIISSLNLAGKLAGYTIYGLASKRFSMRTMIIGTHLLAFGSVAVLLFLLPGVPALSVLFGAVFFLLGIVAALLVNITSVEMLALAKPGNKIMALAFCSTSSAIGQAAGTTLISLLLGCGALAESWRFYGIALTKFQLLFGISALALIFFLLLLPLVPAVVRTHDNYYKP